MDTLQIVHVQEEVLNTGTLGDMEAEIDDITTSNGTDTQKLHRTLTHILPSVKCVITCTLT